MDTQQLITKTERVDNLPLLIAPMRKIGLAELINQPFPAHGQISLSVSSVRGSRTNFSAFRLPGHDLYHVEWVIGGTRLGNEQTMS